MKSPLSLLAALLTCATASPAAVTYVVTDLGVVTDGETSSYANAINASGQICGESGDVVVHAFLRDEATTPPMQSLGTLPGGAADDQSGANAINAGGTVAGYSHKDNNTDIEYHAVYTPLGGTMTKLDIDDTSSVATGINAAGVIVGGFTTATSEDSAFLYDPSQPQSPLIDIGALILAHLADASTSFASGINAAGQVVGSYNAATGPRAYLYDATKFPPVIDLGIADADAYAINDLGQITGRVGNEAYLYDEAHSPKLRKLGTLFAGEETRGLAINNHGHIVGDCYHPAAGGYRAMLWDGALHDLNALIPADSGWILFSSSGINDAGQIVGYGEHDGVTRAFRLDPVPAVDPTEPAPIAPTVKISGKKKVVTTKASVRVKGTATGVVTKVALKNGRKPVKVSGTKSWSANVKLRVGKNRLTATATGPGGASGPAKITIVRKRP